MVIVSNLSFSSSFSAIYYLNASPTFFSNSTVGMSNLYVNATGAIVPDSGAQLGTILGGSALGIAGAGLALFALQYLRKLRANGESKVKSDVVDVVNRKKAGILESIKSFITSPAKMLEAIRNPKKAIQELNESVKKLSKDSLDEIMKEGPEKQVDHKQGQTEDSLKVKTVDSEPALAEENSDNDKSMTYDNRITIDVVEKPLVKEIGAIKVTKRLLSPINRYDDEVPHKTREPDDEEVSTEEQLPNKAMTTISVEEMERYQQFLALMSKSKL